MYGGLFNRIFNANKGIVIFFFFKTRSIIGNNGLFFIILPQNKTIYKKGITTITYIKLYSYRIIILYNRANDFKRNIVPIKQ